MARLLCIALCLLSFCAHAAQDFSPVQKLLNEAVENGEVAGGSVLVLHRGIVVFGKGFGYADIESMTPFKLETPAIVASISKPLLGSAAYRLKEQGKLDPQAPISKYIPEFANQRLMDGTPLKRMPTTTELFAHTSGVRPMESEGGRPWLAKWTAGKSLEEVVSHYAKEFPFETQAGVKHAYSGIGTDIAARVLEVASKCPRNELFQTEVAEPLGMNSTYYRDALSLKKLGTMPTLYKHGDGGRLEVIKSSPVVARNGYASSGGSIISSAPDLARWLLMIRNHGHTEDNKRYLDHETISEMLEGVPSSKNSRCGLFIRKRDKHGKAIIVGHSGSTGTNCWLDFEQDVIGIILTQTRDSDIKAFRSKLEKSIYESLNLTR